MTFEVLWTASIFVTGMPAMLHADIVDFDRLQHPAFHSRRACEAYAYGAAPKMADLISSYFGGADVGIRWRCAVWRP